MEDFEIVLNVILRTTIIFLFVITYTRIMGLRSFSKISSFDFAMTIAVGSTISSGLLNGYLFVPSIIGLFCLFFIQWLIATLRRKSQSLNNWVDNTPILLVRNGEYLKENMNLANITHHDIMAKMREKGIAQPKNVGAVVFETTGNISIIEQSDIADEVLEKVRQ